MQILQGHWLGFAYRMRAEHLREWLQEHQVREAAEELEEEEDISDP